MDQCFSIESMMEAIQNKVIYWIYVCVFRPLKTHPFGQMIGIQFVALSHLHSVEITDSWRVKDKAKTEPR